MDNNLSSLQAGTLLQGGKYRIVRFINSGGFGCTYEAEHVMLENRVAIKEFFVKDFCNRDETTSHVTVGTLSKKALVHKLLRKFVDEARAICKLHHPGIVTVSDIFEENGTAYFVMDYIEGRSLSQMVKSDGPLSEAKALGYIRQVAEALGYVHDHNRLHLDVKPGNIMVDASDRAILIDFGASKQYDEQDGENTSTLMGKTPGYAPLEQMGNDVVRFMPATDIYSLGATLYKLLTGITPLSANLLASGEELPPLPDAVSASTRRAIAVAMQINKNKRPQSIGEFLALLGMGKVQGKQKIEDDEETKPVEDEDTKPTPVLKPQPKPTPKPTRKRNSIFSLKCALTKRRLLGKKINLFLAILVGVLVCIFWLSGGEDVAPSRQTSVKSSSSGIGKINGHDYVDLGLSVKWATCNVGASLPSDYGSYFACGETKTKSKYERDNSVIYEKNIGDISGDSRYDAARAHWGGSWRLPTKAECQELVDKCKWTWTTQGEHNGSKVVGPNGNSIFLPAAGYRYGTSLYGVGESGYYWSSTPDESSTQYEYGLYLGIGNPNVFWYDRYGGRSVRPVSE